MSTDLITEHLDLWTSAVTYNRGEPELTGIAKLRELILELAVRGKLVPQDPEDEPASLLLERIEGEKARLYKEGKVKKPKKLPEIEEEEKPFDVPKEWEWVRLEALTSYIQRGKSPKYSETGSVKVVSQKCVQWRGFLAEPARRVSDESVPDYQAERFLSKGDVLWNSTGTGTVGRVVVFPGQPDPRMVADSHVTVLRFLGIPPVFPETFLKSPYVQERINPEHPNALVSGTTKQVELNTSQIRNLPVPVPPKSEQARIVERVEELMALCDRLERQTSDQLSAHETLVDTLLDTLTRSQDAAELADNWARLAAHFDTLFTTEHSIDRLEQTVLQLAVKGRLVPQDPAEEPAKELMRKLYNERENWLIQNADADPECRTMLKKTKTHSLFGSSLINIPENWVSTSLIQVARMMVDCHNKTAPYVNSGIPIIRTSNIKGRRFIMEGVRYVDEPTYEYWSKRCPPEPHDIIFTREAPMGEAAIIPEGARWCLGQRTMLIRPMHNYIYNRYLLLAITDPDLLGLASESAVGATVKHLRVGDVEGLEIPVPPLAEQYRIVEEFDELMALCQRLKSLLGKSKRNQRNLAESLVKKTVA